MYKKENNFNLFYFLAEEFQNRYKKTTQLMNEYNIDLLLVTSKDSTENL